MAGVYDVSNPIPVSHHEDDRGQGSGLGRWRWTLAIGALIALAAAAIIVYRWTAIASTDVWKMVSPARQLQLLAAVLPGSIIVNHMIYVLGSRRRQFRQALAPGQEMDALADLYFARVPTMVRYLLPAVLSAIVCAMVMAALTSPDVYVQWLWAPMAATARWPTAWGGDALRGAAFGFAGAYVYVLLMLTDRARQRDITSGIAVWAASMPVLGSIMGGVAALLIAAGTGSTSTESSFTRDAVFFVAGMLPQQFAAFVQTGVRKIFQPSTPSAVRTLPLTLLRGVGPEVEARLQEEGIHDLSALAYASPYALIRATTYAPKQIADWIDEALLIATVPSQWDALEKVGVTGAMDLAWYSGNAESIAALAGEIKMTPKMLENVIDRLNLDAQVKDLERLYWDGQSQMPHNLTAAASPAATAGPSLEPELKYTFVAGLQQDARDRFVAEASKIDGVRKVTTAGDEIRVSVIDAQRALVDEQLKVKKEIAPV